MRYKHLLIFIFSCTVLFACAQNKYGIKRSYSFFREQFPGSIPVDDKGNPLISGPDTVYLAVLEIDLGSGINWENAYLNGQTFKVYKTELDFPLKLKSKAEENKSPDLTAQKGNRMVYLSLQKTNNDSIPNHIASRIKGKNSIWLEGMQNEKKVLIQLPPLKELEAIPHY